MKLVEQIAKRIARTIPIEGSRWNPGFGHDFPREYTEAEKGLIRGIAKDALSAMREPSLDLVHRALHDIDDKRGLQRESVQVFREFYGAMIGAALEE